MRSPHYLSHPGAVRNSVVHHLKEASRLAPLATTPEGAAQLKEECRLALVQATALEQMLILDGSSAS